jgi:hypothetical protein
MIAKVGIPFENLWVLLNGHRREKLQKTFTTYNQSHYSNNYESMKKGHKVQDS